MFDPEKFRDEATETIEKLIKSVPNELKADMAAFISLQVVIFGADNMYEGMGIFEANKIEYLDICNEVMEDDVTDLSLN